MSSVDDIELLDECAQGGRQTLQTLFSVPDSAYTCNIEYMVAVRRLKLQRGNVSLWNFQF